MTLNKYLINFNGFNKPNNGNHVNNQLKELFRFNFAHESSFCWKKGFNRIFPSKKNSLKFVKDNIPGVLRGSKTTKMYFWSSFYTKMNNWTLLKPEIDITIYGDVEKNPGPDLKEKHEKWNIFEIIHNKKNNKFSKLRHNKIVFVPSKIVFCLREKKLFNEYSYHRINENIVPIPTSVVIRTKKCDWSIRDIHFSEKSFNYKEKKRKFEFAVLEKKLYFIQLRNFFVNDYYGLKKVFWKIKLLNLNSQIENDGLDATCFADGKSSDLKSNNNISEIYEKNLFDDGIKTRSQDVKRSKRILQFVESSLFEDQKGMATRAQEVIKEEEMLKRQNYLYNLYLQEKENKTKLIGGGKSGDEFKPNSSESSEDYEFTIKNRRRKIVRESKKRYIIKKSLKKKKKKKQKKDEDEEYFKKISKNNRKKKRKRSKKLKLEETKRKTRKTKKDFIKKEKSKRRTRKIKKEKIIKKKKDTDSLSFDPEKVTPPSERDLIISDGSYKGTPINSQKNTGKAKTTQDFFLDNPDKSVMSCNDEEYKENIKLELGEIIPDYEYEYFQSQNNNEENEEKSITKNNDLTIEKTKENDVTMTDNKVDEELYLDQEIPDSVFSFLVEKELVEKEKVQKKKLKRERENSFGDNPKKRRNLPRKVKRTGPIKYSGYKLGEIVDGEEKKDNNGKKENIREWKYEYGLPEEQHMITNLSICRHCGCERIGTENSSSCCLDGKYIIEPLPNPDEVLYKKKILKEGLADSSEMDISSDDENVTSQISNFEEKVNELGELSYFKLLKKNNFSNNSLVINNMNSFLALGSAYKDKNKEGFDKKAESIKGVGEFVTVRGQLYSRALPGDFLGPVKFFITGSSFEDKYEDLNPNEKIKLEQLQEQSRIFDEIMNEVNPFVKNLKRLGRTKDVSKMKVVYDSGKDEISVVFLNDNEKIETVGIYFCKKRNEQQINNEKEFKDAREKGIKKKTKKKEGMTKKESLIEELGWHYVKHYDRCWEPLLYPTLFPLGKPGWGLVMEIADNKVKWKKPKSNKGNDMKLQYHVRQRCLREERFKLAGRATQMYLCDQYIRKEKSKLDYIRYNQGLFRKSKLSNVMKVVEKNQRNAEKMYDVFCNNDEFIMREKYEGTEKIGKKFRYVYLPSSFPNSRRYMQRYISDGHYISGRLQQPTYFITMTTNVFWSEILYDLYIPHKVWIPIIRKSYEKESNFDFTQFFDILKNHDKGRNEVGPIWNELVNLIEENFPNEIEADLEDPYFLINNLCDERKEEFFKSFFRIIKKGSNGLHLWCKIWELIENTMNDKNDFYLYSFIRKHLRNETITKHNGQSAFDRPILTCRVFKQKIEDLIKNVKNGKIFGREALYYMYVIEFQKRGLPHIHMCVRTKGKQPESKKEIGSSQVIRADLPDKKKEPLLHFLVDTLMKHNHKWPSEKSKGSICCRPINGKLKYSDGRCNKGFPQKICSETKFVKGGYVQYKREEKDRFIPTYNGDLLKRYRCHLNISLCSTVGVIGYLYKYIYKGPDSANVTVQKENKKEEEDGLDDEIAEFVNKRYVSACEAAWTLLGYKKVKRSVSVVRLNFDVPIKKNGKLISNDTIIFHENKKAEEILQKKEKENEEEDGRKNNIEKYFDRPTGRLIGMTKDFEDYTYPEYFENFILNKKLPESLKTKSLKLYQYNKKKGEGHYYAISKNGDFVYSPLIKNPRLARLYLSHPGQGERYWMRKLLIEKSARCYEDYLKDDKGNSFETFEESCYANGIVHGVEHYFYSMAEVVSMAYTPRELRDIFVQIIENCVDTPKEKLLQEFGYLMAEDFILSENSEAEVIVRNGQFTPFENKIGVQICDWTKNKLYSELKYLLESKGNDFKKHFPNIKIEEKENRDEIIREKNNMKENLENDLQLLKNNYNNLMKNKEQKEIFELICGNVLEKRQCNIFVNGKAGTGKTFLFKTICSYLRSLGKIVLCASSTGLASLDYERGMTFHSLFGYGPTEFISGQDPEPIESKFGRESQRASLLRNCDLIIIDEIPMLNKHYLSQMDEDLKDFCGNDLPFGGKSIIFGGDFRQTAPIVINGNKINIENASIKNLELFRENVYFKKLLINQRAVKDNDFCMYLDSIGDGNEPSIIQEEENNFNKLINLDKRIKKIKTEEEMITKIHPDIQDSRRCSRSAILAPTNEVVDSLNSICIDKFNGEQKIFVATDEFIGETNKAIKKMYKKGEFDESVDDSYFSRLRHSGVPNHAITLKKGCLAMILRNLSYRNGIMNGTKVIIKEIKGNTIKCQSVKNGKTIFVTRIDFIFNDKVSKRKVKRRQFPIKLCYAMTINKSQGQTMDKVCLNLDPRTKLNNEIFGHGQLYTALSRVRSFNDIFVFDGTSDNKNVEVNNVVYLSLVEDLTKMFKKKPIISTTKLKFDHFNKFEKKKEDDIVMKDKAPKYPWFYSNKVGLEKYCRKIRKEFKIDEKVEKREKLIKEKNALKNKNIPIKSFFKKSNKFSKSTSKKKEMKKTKRKKRTFQEMMNMTHDQRIRVLRKKVIEFYNDNPLNNTEFLDYLERTGYLPVFNGLNYNSKINIIYKYMRKYQSLDTLNCSEAFRTFFNFSKDYFRDKESKIFDQNIDLISQSEYYRNFSEELCKDLLIEFYLKTEGVNSTETLVYDHCNVLKMVKRIYINYELNCSSHEKYFGDDDISYLLSISNSNLETFKQCLKMSDSSMLDKNRNYLESLFRNAQKNLDEYVFPFYYSHHFTSVHAKKSNNGNWIIKFYNTIPKYGKDKNNGGENYEKFFNFFKNVIKVLVTEENIRFETQIYEYSRNSTHSTHKQLEDVYINCGMWTTLIIERILNGIDPNYGLTLNKQDYLNKSREIRKYFGFLFLSHTILEMENRYNKLKETIIREYEDDDDIVPVNGNYESRNDITSINSSSDSNNDIVIIENNNQINFNENKERSKYEKDLPENWIFGGVKNLKKTCFFSCLLYFIKSIDPLVKYIRNIAKETKNKRSISKELVKFFDTKENIEFDPSNIIMLMKEKNKNLFEKNRKKEYKQQDCNEYYLELMNMISSERKSKKENDNFLRYKREVNRTCQNCKNSYKREQYFYNSEIYESNWIESFKKEKKETITDYKCEECNQNSKQERVFSEPKLKKTEVLIFSVKRFTQTRKKKYFPIEIPENFEIGEKTKKFYVLKSIVKHNGDISSGHYTIIRTHKNHGDVSYDLFNDMGYYGEPLFVTDYIKNKEDFVDAYLLGYQLEKINGEKIDYNLKVDNDNHENEFEKYSEKNNNNVDEPDDDDYDDHLILNLVNFQKIMKMF